MKATTRILSSLMLTSLTAAPVLAEQLTSEAERASSQGSVVVSARNGQGETLAKQQNAAAPATEHKALTVAKKASRDSSVQERVAKSASNQAKTGKFAQVSTAKIRDKNPLLSSKNHEFYFYDAQSWLLSDLDGDGYYSEFRIRFDADTIYSFADVYAVLYLSRNGGDWIEYHVTDVFEINGETGADAYQVTTRLNLDYPPGEYDVLIDLYEYGYSGIVATISDYDDISLSLLPLEDVTYEQSSVQGFWFYDVVTDLITDEDNDGFYSTFAFTFDVDSDYAATDVYAEIYFLNEFDEWELDYTSSDFTIYGDSASDKRVVEFDWNSGYPSGYYDFKIVIRDAISDERLVEASSELGALSQIPLESYDRDDAYNNGGGSSGGSGSGSGGGSSTSYESGGGSLGGFALLTALLLMIRRRS